MRNTTPKMAARRAKSAAAAVVEVGVVLVVVVRGQGEARDVAEHG
jgi:hypothetical protein